MRYHSPRLNGPGTLCSHRFVAITINSKKKIIFPGENLILDSHWDLMLDHNEILWDFQLDSYEISVTAIAWEKIRFSGVSQCL